jgi:hypothetical protein
MANEEFDPDAAGRISAAIVKAIAEAKVSVDTASLGPDRHNVIQHACELNDLLREQVATATPDRFAAYATSMPDRSGWLRNSTMGAPNRSM